MPRPVAALRGGPLRRLAAVAVLALGAAHAEDLPEHRLKAAFLYNFALYTDWPADPGPSLTLCVRGRDPLGRELDALDGKAVGAGTLRVQRGVALEALGGCQLVFIAAGSIDTLPRVLEALRGRPVLTIADTPGAARQGVMLNMTVDGERVSFEANLQAARAAGLFISSKLLRLATEVMP